MFNAANKGTDNTKISTSHVIKIILFFLPLTTLPDTERHCFFFPLCLSERAKCTADKGRGEQTPDFFLKAKLCFSTQWFCDDLVSWQQSLGFEKGILKREL